MTSSFISFLGQPSFYNIPACITVVCSYDVTKYQDLLFQTNGIRFEDCLREAAVKRKAEFLAGRICAQKALSQIGIADWQIAVGKSRSPIFPQPILGSISHTNDSAVCAISSRKECAALGIDEEIWVDHLTARQIQAQILSKQEYTLCNSIPLDFAQALTLFFSAKETFFKAYYVAVGHYFGFEEAEVISIDMNGNHGVLRMVPSVVIAPHLPRSTLFHVDFQITADRVMTYHHLPNTR